MDDTYMRPGEDWQRNNGPRQYREFGGGVGSYWVRYDWTTHQPQVYTADRNGRHIRQRALRAKADPYPRPPFTKKQRFFFAPEQVFSSAVDEAVVTDGDTTLFGEVIGYRNRYERTQQLAQKLDNLWDEFRIAQKAEWESALCLAKANVYHRLLPKVLAGSDPLEVDGPRANAVDALLDNWFEEEDLPYSYKCHRRYTNTWCRGIVPYEVGS
jgi:hypothetical protein